MDAVIPPLGDRGFRVVMDALQTYASDSESSSSETDFVKRPRLADSRGTDDQNSTEQSRELRTPRTPSSLSSFPYQGNEGETRLHQPSAEGEVLTIKDHPYDNERTESSDSLKAGMSKLGASSLRSSLSGVSSSLPPPPPDLLNSLNSSPLLKADDRHNGRIRSFPHVEGNFALHIYIPVSISSIAKQQLEPLIIKAACFAPELQSMEVDVTSHPVHLARKSRVCGLKLAKEYHISLSRTVPIRIHQIDSIVPMLRHKFSGQKRYWVEFGKWEAFVNDENSRSFLALEVTDKGSSEICKQIHCVNEVFRLHNLPTFYENPRPHISVAWALGNVSPSLKKAVEELNKLRADGVNSHRSPIWSHLFNIIECKIGNQTYCVWKATMQPKVASS